MDQLKREPKKHASDVKIVLPYEMGKSLQKCQNNCVTYERCTMYNMHELFSMSIKNDMIIIQFKFVLLISIKYRVNNQLFEVQE